MRKLSVVIPFYNSELYMHRMIDSVLAQTYEDIELILVNDGSTDGTKAICERYAEDHKDRVKFINFDSNKGPSEARNAGISAAGGEYLLFVDSDDYLLPDICMTLVKTLGKTSSDAVRFEAYNVPWDEDLDIIPDNEEALSKTVEASGWQRISYPDGLYSNKEFLDNLLYHDQYYPVWNVLWQRKAIDNILFHSDMRIGEDHMFWMDFISACERKIYNIKKVGYIRYMRPDSLSSQKPSQRVIWNRRVAVSMFENCKKWDCVENVCLRAYERVLRYANLTLSQKRNKLLYTDDMCMTINCLHENRHLLKQCDLNRRGKAITMLLIHFARIKQKLHKY